MEMTLNLLRSDYLKKAIFRNLLAILCIYAAFSGFSFSSSAKEKVKGFIISSNSDAKTIEKVNNRIVDLTEDSKGYDSYIVNVDNKVDFSLASLLSLKNKAVVVAISEDNSIDDKSEEILKNSKKVYVIGDKKSVNDKILKDLDLNFERIGSSNIQQTNELVNKFQGEKDLLIVDKKENVDMLGAVHFANIYDMNLLFVDSNEKLTNSQKNIIANVGISNNIYFYDGITIIPNEYKENVYKEAKRDIENSKNFELDAKDILKILKDKIIAEKKKKDLVVSEEDSLVGMIYSYVFAEKNNLNYILAKDESVDFDTEQMIKDISPDNIYFLSNQDNERYIYLRLIMSSLNSCNFSNFEIDKETSEIKNISFPSTKEALKDIENVSEEVSLKEDEKIVDGKVISEKEQVDAQKEQEQNISSKDNFSYKKMLIMDSTAYSSDGNDYLTPGHVTATGQDLWKNPMAVAVDTSVIPLGTRLYVEGYGYATASDTGSAIKGNIIDVHFKTTDECNNWGRKMVKVYILD